MTNLGDALQGAFAAHEAAERGRARDPHRTVLSIRRRRTVRAAGTGTAAVVGVGAVGAVWLSAPGGPNLSPGQPAPTTQCTDAQLYLPANPEALGDTDFTYRAYVDLRPDSPTHGVVVVRKDGTRVRVEAGADGTYSYLGTPNVFPDWPEGFAEQPMVTDNFAGGGGGDLWDGVSPVTEDYQWTVDVPPNAPAGIDTEQLSSSLRVGMGLGGSGYDDSFVPGGAVTDFIITTTEGETEVTRVAYGGPSNTQDEPQDVASLALRVSNLPDGGTYTITATHHAVDPALTACASVSDSVSVSATPTGTPQPAPTEVLPGSSPAPGVSEGGTPPVLAGPESQVFACGAVLHPELLGDLGFDVTWETGLVEDAAGDMVDFGGGGVRAVGSPPGGPASGEFVELNSWSRTDDGEKTLEVFAAVGVVDGGELIGLAPTNDGPPGDRDRLSFWWNGRGGEHLVTASLPDVDARLTACDGEYFPTPKSLETVLLLGTGPIGGPYEFAWTPVERP